MKLMILKIIFKRKKEECINLKKQNEEKSNT